jgi:UDP-2,3-diacylglucosamine pyrophosphatase LpxH
LLASFLKYKTKNTGQYVYNFGQEPRSGSPKSGLPDVLWRHVHRTEMTKIRGVDYFSCDDWVKISTALVEHSAGEMEIISYTDNNNSLKKHSPIQGSLI